MTDQEIKQYTLEEAAKLRLSSWEIKVEALDKIGDGGRDGECEWFTDMHQVTIRIKAGMSDEDTRWTVRHELIHLRLEGHKPYSKYDAMYEFGINCISKAWR